jgi:hypothetical protein
MVSAQSSGTNKNGIISSDEIWTKSGSPYTLTGPVAILEGVTLTIEQGVTVNIGGFYLQINGTLRAKGTNTENIHFTFAKQEAFAPNNMGFPITFNPSSGTWNEQTGSGCIIENAILEGISPAHAIIQSTNASPKINNNTITGTFGIGGSSRGHPIISNNKVHGCIGAGMESPIIFNNIITNDLSDTSTVTTGIGMGNGGAVVFNNVISGCYFGIATGANSIVSNNQISNCKIGINVDVENDAALTVERNLIVNCSITGLQIVSGAPTVRANTISRNEIGVTLSYRYNHPAFISATNPNPTITNNNIVGSTSYSLKSYLQQNIKATSNWWGTTDEVSINQSIYDSKNDFNLGKVTFTPFLTQENAQASPDPNAPLPTPNTPTPSTTPTTNPTTTNAPSPVPATAQPPETQTFVLFGLVWWQMVIIILVAVIAVLVVVIVFMKKRS